MFQCCFVCLLVELRLISSHLVNIWLVQNVGFLCFTHAALGLSAPVVCGIRSARQGFVSPCHLFREATVCPAVEKVAHTVSIENYGYSRLFGSVVVVVVVFLMVLSFKLLLMMIVVCTFPFTSAFCVSKFGFSF